MSLGTETRGSAAMTKHSFQWQLLLFTKIAINETVYFPDLFVVWCQIIAFIHTKNATVVDMKKGE